MKLILIRHGETDLNKKGAFQGTSDMVLSDKGREQVQRLGERIYFTLKRRLVSPETGELILRINREDRQDNESRH